MTDLYMNSTVSSISMTNTIGNSAGLGMIAGLVLCTVCVIILIGLASSLERYQKFWKGLTFIISSLRFTAYGGIATGIAYGVFLLGSMLVTVGGGIDPVVYLYGIAALVGFTIIGYGVEILVKRILANHEKTVGKTAETNTPLLDTL